MAAPIHISISASSDRRAYGTIPACHLILKGSRRVTGLLASRRPSRAEVWPVFSVFAFLVYSWALYRMFWYIPSWIEYLSLGNILVIAAYTLGFALLESGVMLGLTLLLCLAFPPRWFRQQFTAQASALAAVLGGGAFLIQRQASMIYDWTTGVIYAGMGGVLIGVVIFVLASAWLFRRFPILPRLVCAIAERMTIFALLYIPLGVLGVVVILLRNLF